MSKKAMALPSDHETQEIWERTALRRRILDEKHRLDATTVLHKHIDPKRAAAWGPVDLSYNLFRSYIHQVAVLHDEKPLVANEEMGEVEALYLATLDLWAKAVRHDRLVLACGESLIKLRWAPGNHVAHGGVTIDLVTADQVVVTDSPDAPGHPIRIEQAGTWKDEPIWEVWDISDPADPYYRIETHEKRRDITAQVKPDASRWDDYDSDGVPYLPWVLYHSEAHEGLFKSPLSSLVHGTLNTTVLYSFFVHSVKTASWQQKVGVDVQLQGAATVGSGENARSSVPTDPASILLFRSEKGGGSVSTLAEASRPGEILDAIRAYSSGVLESMGMSAADVEKHSPESGVAIQLKRDAIRDVQRRHVEQFRAGDIELLEKVAKISNRFGAGARVPRLPESGWSITYPALPMSREELDARFERMTKKVDRGILSVVDLYLADHPGMSREEAMARLDEIRSENVRFGKTPTM